MAADVREARPSDHRRDRGQQGRAGRPRGAGRARQARGAGRAPPSTDTLLLDADPEQEQVVAEVESGSSLVVKTLPGTGGTQTIVNSIGALVAKDKRVLVVGARRASLDGIAHRLGQVGLEWRGRHDREPAPRPHPVDLAQREGRAASGRRRRRCARAPPQGAARLPRGTDPARPRAARLGARRARRARSARPAPAGALDDGAARSRRPRRARRRPRPGRARPRAGRGARRVPLRPGRLALVRRVVHLVRRGHPCARAGEATERHRTAAAPRARTGADRADPAAAVRVGRRAGRVPAPAPRRARDPRPLPPLGVRPAARRAHRRDLARVATRPACRAPIVVACAASRSSTCAPAFTSPT